MRAVQSPADSKNNTISHTNIIIIERTSNVVFLRFWQKQLLNFRSKGGGVGLLCDICDGIKLFNSSGEWRYFSA